MAVDIGPKIGIDGEKEFREQLNSINQDLRTLNSQMKAVTSSFDAGDDSQEALTEQTAVLNEQIEKQQKKLELLRKGMNDAAEVTGENSKQTKRWEQGVYDATAELNRMKKQLDKTGDGMQDISKDTGKASDKMEELKDTASEVDERLKNFFIGGAVATGLKALVSGMADLVEETKEYRTIMASLEVSSRKANYTVGQTEEVFNKLYNVLGDTQTAATTTANLQAIGLSQKDLIETTYAVIGAWSSYGDSIPIDGLAESINETIKAGQVTGNFADVLNWANGSEDEFNAQLEKCKTTAERMNLVLELLTNQGLANAGKEFEKQNPELIEYNAAQKKLNDSTGRLAETLTPFATLLKEGGAALADWANVAILAWEEAFGETFPKAIQDGVEGVKSFFPAVKETGDAWGQWVVDKTNGAVDAVKQGALEWGEILTVQIPAEFDESITAIKGWGNDIKEEMSKLPGAIKEYGKQMVTGLWDGVKEKSAWLKGKVSGFISEIKSAFTGPSGFDIHSPSKWARKQFAYVMEGAGEGFSDGLPYAMTSADNAMAALQSRMTMSVATPEASANNAAAGIVNGLIASTGGNNGNQPVTIVLQTDNGAEIARWLLPDIRAAQRANPEVVSGI